MDNLTIRKKLGVVFTLLILVFLGASVYAGRNLDLVVAANDDLANAVLEAQKSVG